METSRNGINFITNFEHFELPELPPLECAVNELQRNLPFSLSQNQFDALVSFAHNVGVESLATFRGKSPQFIADEMLKYCYVSEKKDSKLKHRRKAERELFLSRTNRRPAAGPVEIRRAPEYDDSYKDEYPRPTSKRAPEYDDGYYRPAVEPRYKRRAPEYDDDYDRPVHRRRAPEYDDDYDRPVYRRRVPGYDDDYDRPVYRRRAPEYDNDYNRLAYRRRAPEYDNDYNRLAYRRRAPEYGDDYDRPVYRRRAPGYEDGYYDDYVRYHLPCKKERISCQEDSKGSGKSKKSSNPSLFNEFINAAGSTITKWALDEGMKEAKRYFFSDDSVCERSAEDKDSAQSFTLSESAIDIEHDATSGNGDDPEAVQDEANQTSKEN